MPVWTVCGKKELIGSHRIQGAKNAVLPIMAASLLGGGVSHLSDCPRLLDVSAALDILHHLGCSTHLDNGSIIIDSGGMCENDIPHELMLKMRSSVMFMGAILARCGEVHLSAPGGCELGSRPIDLHLKALTELGAQVRQEGGRLHISAKRLIGKHINLDFPSVGATENIMLAACAAEGTTLITNAAREPEIVDLEKFLAAKGARISGAGTSAICIEGFSPRPYTYHRVMPDRIALSSFLCACAAAGGDICLENAVSAHVFTVLSSLKAMGCDIMYDQSSIRLKSRGVLRAAKPVVTSPYPGFPTDAQALLMAACLKADGTSVFVENIFENRYRHVPEMRRLGADIRTEGRVAMVTGVDKLIGAPVSACDLRGGAALVIAALSAEGISTINDPGHIERGYSDLDTGLRALGAEISKG